MALELRIGDSLVFTVQFDYQGPAYKGAVIRVSIGQRIPLFDEILHTEQIINIPQSPTMETYKETFSIPITTAIAPKENYDLEVKITKIPGALFWKEDDVIDVLATAADFQNLSVTYKKA